MIRLLLLIFLLVLNNNISNAQIAYQENFGTGCSTGNLATTFGWTVTNTGVNEVSANTWYVSAAENGGGAGACGVGCGGIDSRTLHVGTTAFGDLGASYFESSAFACSFLGLCARTDKRVESPTINCSGISSIPFSFDYIENGEASNDNATIWYSANNGGTWTLIDNLPKSALCGAQGLWTSRTITLPASANNNPTVKIGFRWVNNGNGIGTDPSFAVDNIQIGIPLVLPVIMQSMQVTCVSGETIIQWNTLEEWNNDYFTVYKSLDGISWEAIGTVNSVGKSSEIIHYELIDNTKTESIVYYYIEQTDLDGKRTTFEILKSENCFEPGNTIFLYPNPSNGKEFNVISNNAEILKTSIYTIDGRFIGETQSEDRKKFLKITSDLLTGSYIAIIQTTKESKSVQFNVLE